MLKQTVALLVLSLLVILTTPYTQHAMQYLLDAHDWIAQTLTQVFSGGEVGDMIRRLIALLAVPILVGLVPALLYWAIKRSWFPYFMHLVWVTWFLQAGALLIMAKVATS